MDDKDSQHCAWYNELETKAGDLRAAIPAVLRIFELQNGDYYHAYGANAEYIAERFFNTRDILKFRSFAGNDADSKRIQMPFVTLRPQKVQTIIREVLSGDGAQMNIQLWKSRKGQWLIVKEASPGNIQGLEDILFRKGEDMAETPLLMALQLSKDAQSLPLVGVALVDASLRVIEVCQFVDNAKFINLKALVAQRSPKECILPKSMDNPTAEGSMIADILRDNEVSVEMVPLSHFKKDSITQDLKRLVGAAQQHIVLQEYEACHGAVAAVIKHLKLLADETVHGHYKLETYDLSQYMRLDISAVQALHLMPTATDSNKNMNLYGLLHHGKTASGSRLLSKWIKQPLIDVTQIETRLNLVEALIDDTQLRRTLLETCLNRLPDFERYSKKFLKGSAKLEDLIIIFKAIVRLPGLKNELEAHDGPHKALLTEKFIEPVKTLISDFAQLECMVEQTIDMDALERREYIINPEFNEVLKELRASKDEVYDGISSMHADIAESLSLSEDKVKLNHHTTHGYHLRVTRKDEKHIRNKGSILTLETRKDGVRFTTVKLRRLSQQYEELTKEYENAQSEIVRQCMTVVATYCPVMERCSLLLAELDVLAGFASASVSAPSPYCRPKVHPLGSGVLNLKQSRHPCVEAQDMSFIANDIELRKGDSNVVIITGPNMGGKSTFIRQVGVISLMAQIGCFVPCDEAEVSVVDCILARVGAGDVQLRGVSTFMKEMLEASSILKCASPNSLIIIDELGRGTSTYDGFGLAWAISEYIAKKVKAFTLFATHFHELTALADTVGGVVNKHVTAHTDDNSITMLYQVNDGPCDRSFGIHVSELANFPPSVVKMAKRKAFELEDFGSRAADVVGAIKPMEVDGDEEAAPRSPKKAKKSNAFEKQLQTPEHVKSGDRCSALLKEFASMPLNTADTKQRLAAFQQKLEAVLGPQS